MIQNRLNHHAPVAPSDVALETDSTSSQAYFTQTSAHWPSRASASPLLTGWFRCSRGLAGGRAASQ